MNHTIILGNHFLPSVSNSIDDAANQPLILNCILEHNGGGGGYIDLSWSNQAVSGW